MSELALVEQARALRITGLSFREVAERMNVSHSTVRRWLEENVEHSVRGLVATLPPKELLTSQKGGDGRWHAHYPTGTRTLCGRDVGPIKRGPKMLPDCGVCSKTARAFDRVNPSCPPHWLPEPVEVEAA